MTYQRPGGRAGALRLHLNENTGGCSPAVIEALRTIDCTYVATYPDYADLYRECAGYLEVNEDRLLLTNGLDEGLLAATVAAFRPDQAGARVPEAVVVLPAFDMYGIFVRSSGGRLVTVPPAAEFAFPLDGVLKAITPKTRLVILNTPHNPTGQLIAHADVAAVANAAPHATVFVDEAYWDFSGESFLLHLETHPNVVVGRTFAKAHGLAGLRAGCLIGNPAHLEPMRGVVPPYSLSVFAVAGWLAALRDRSHLAWYKQQVAESRDLLYAACRRLGFSYWPSAANFVLINVGNDADALAARLESRGILVRVRSADPGCAGCIRVTAGVVEHTKAAITALEELCAAD